MSRSELYPFQLEDCAKIHKAGRGLIGSEMGVGKTLQAIELDERWYDGIKLPTLVVAPLNTFSSWQEKYSNQSPKSDVTVIDRKNREKFLNAIRRKEGDVFLMHWDALRLMPELRGHDFGLIVADEVHRAANRKAQATRALKKLRTFHKLGMSGTASGDRPENLWSILHWLYPKEYTSYWNFYNRYVEHEIVYPHGYHKVVGVKNVKELHERMLPFYVRHLKRSQCCTHHPEGVMPWLPDKTYETIWVELGPAQRRAYESMRKNMLAWVGDHEETPLTASIVAAQLVRLSQMAIAMPYIDGDIVKLGDPSSKIDAAQELFRDNPEKQFVLFSSSKKACYLASERFKKVGITNQVLSGDVNNDTIRHGMVKSFANGDYQVFIGVIAAAGEGIDGLQHATDTAVFLDRSWSARQNQQAEDRLHRGGQKDTVEIIDIMARNTIDLGRRQKLTQKWDWIKTLLGDKFDNSTYKEEVA